MIHINLIEEDKKIFITKIIVLIIIILVFVLITGLYSNKKNQLVELDKEIIKIEEMLKKYRLHVEENQNHQREAVLKVKKPDKRWGESIIELGYVVPKGIRISICNYDGKKLKLNGVAANKSTVMKFVENLNYSPVYTNVRTISLDSEEKLDSDEKLNFVIEVDITKNEG
ncbi:MAG: PilN domain-containing protein [Bacillota bacterium]